MIVQSVCISFLPIFTHHWSTQIQCSYMQIKLHLIPFKLRRSNTLWPSITFNTMPLPVFSLLILHVHGAIIAFVRFNSLKIVFCTSESIRRLVLNLFHSIKLTHNHKCNFSNVVVLFCGYLSFVWFYYLEWEEFALTLSFSAHAQSASTNVSKHLIAVYGHKCWKMNVKKLWVTRRRGSRFNIDINEHRSGFWNIAI